MKADNSPRGHSLAYPRFRRMLAIVSSGAAAGDVSLERDEICDECPNVKTDRKGRARCGSCRCPDWLLNRLRFKNRRAANHCPEKRHPGEYIQLVTHLWPNRKNQEIAKPAKTGCGGGRHG